MRKHQFYALLGALLFAAGFALTTGIDQNPIQALYACALIGGAVVCFRLAELKVKNEE